MVYLVLVLVDKLIKLDVLMEPRRPFLDSALDLDSGCDLSSCKDTQGQCELTAAKTSATPRTGNGRYTSSWITPSSLGLLYHTLLMIV